MGAPRSLVRRVASAVGDVALWWVVLPAALAVVALAFLGDLGPVVFFATAIVIGLALFSLLLLATLAAIKEKEGAIERDVDGPPDATTGDP